jgi:hypothetical protein
VSTAIFTLGNASFVTSVTLFFYYLGPRDEPFLLLVCRRDGLPFSAFWLGGEGIADTSVRVCLMEKSFDGER